MKLVFVAITFSVVLLARADEASEDDKELTECGNKFAEKVVALSGDFLDKDEILELLQKVFDMYYKEKKTLREINDYYISNYRNVGLSPEQVDTLTDVYNKVAEIMGGAQAVKDFHKKAQDMALEFIKEDQRQVDQTIKELSAKQTPAVKIELAVCQQVFTLTTALKKIQLENKMFALVPADKLEAIKQQIRRIGKLLTDSNN